jgi:hypothetical protein
LCELTLSERSGLAFVFTGGVIAFWLATSLPIMHGERPRHGPWLLAGMAAVVVVGTLCLASPAFSGAPWLGRYFWVSATQTVAATALLVPRYLFDRPQPGTARSLGSV